MFLFIKIESPNNTSSVQPGESQLFQRPLEVEAPCPNHISCLPMGPENAGGRGVHSFLIKLYMLLTHVIVYGLGKEGYF